MSWMDKVIEATSSGGGGGGSQPFIATFTWDSDLEEWSCDKTPEEIKAAADSGQVVMCDVPDIHARGYLSVVEEYDDGGVTKTGVMFSGTCYESDDFAVFELYYSTDSSTVTFHPLP